MGVDLWARLYFNTITMLGDKKHINWAKVGYGAASSGAAPTRGYYGHHSFFANSGVLTTTARSKKS
ncbi:hypothetical protein [Rhodococcus sp. ACT016]|uniref:hypothetical protein n=1 Tax=Rhodococcus sp. ACT016 TaxID=3134808 RepID=UPI003D283EC7